MPRDRRTNSGVPSLAFEPRDLPAHGGRHDVQTTGGVGNGAGVDHFEEVADGGFLKNAGAHDGSM
jgi:hypothetical protein